MKLPSSHAAHPWPHLEECSMAGEVGGCESHGKAVAAELAAPFLAGQRAPGGDEQDRNVTYELCLPA